MLQSVFATNDALRSDDVGNHLSRLVSHIIKVSDDTEFGDCFFVEWIG
jgi:hypothetical protein